ncbi:DUF1127 domain-containing protein, partial [Mesorhizobium sp. M7A.F.Ca.US.001.01.1.1]
MSKIDRTYPSASERGSERKSRTTVRQLFLRAIRQWQRSRAINELSRLDNRQLEDIGRGLAPSGLKRPSTTRGMW